MAFTALIEGDNEGFQFSPIDEDRLQQLVVSLVDTQEELLAGVLQRVDADRRHHRARANRGKIAAFHGRRSRSGGSSIQAGQAPQARCGRRTIERLTVGDFTVTGIPLVLFTFLVT